MIKQSNASVLIILIKLQELVMLAQKAVVNVLPTLAVNHASKDTRRILVMTNSVLFVIWKTVLLVLKINVLSVIVHISYKPQITLV
jgi:hypothetical protein